MKAAKKLICALLFFTFMMFSGFTENVRAESNSGLELYNKDGITITVTGIAEGKSLSYINMTFVNNGTRGVTIGARGLSVNDYMIHTVMSVDVPAGEARYIPLLIILSEIQQKYITTFADIEFSLIISDTETGNIIDTEPAALTVIENEDYVQAHYDAGDVLCDENGIRIISKGLEDVSDGQALVLYAENNSGVNVGISTSCANINGSLEPVQFEIQELPSGKFAIDGMLLPVPDTEEDPEEQNIYRVEFVLRFYDPSTMEPLGNSQPIWVPLR